MQKKQSVFAFLFQAIGQFEIDKKGTFKYIQIQCQNKTTHEKTLFIRGKGGHIKFHKIIFQYFFDQVKSKDFQIVDTKIDHQKTLLNFTINHKQTEYKFTCIGGGRMIHDPEHKKLEIYGYSKTYGKVIKVKHTAAVRIALNQLNNKEY